MKIKFLGVGDAYDERNGNTSILIRTYKNILIDCGFSVPFCLWEESNDKDFLDAIYISHDHSDHILGLPSVLSRLNNQNRKNPIKIIGSKKVIESILTIFKIVKPDLLLNSSFKIDFVVIDNKSKIEIGDIALKFALTKHSTVNYAIRIEAENKVICYSGDGIPTKETIMLYKNSDLLIHEAFSIFKKQHDHTNTLKLNILFSLNIENIYLVHVKRVERLKMIAYISDISHENSGFKIVLPEKSESIEF